MSGRKTNDGMGAWIADTLHDRRGGRAGSALVLGLTFKENVPDLRNSRSFDLIARLRELGHEVEIDDPLASPQEVEREYGLRLDRTQDRAFDLVIGAVAHQEYRDLSDEALNAMITEGGTLADLKGMWRDRVIGGDHPVDRWQL